VAYAAEFFRWFAEEAVRIDGRFAVPPNGKGGCSPCASRSGHAADHAWNFPLAMGTRKIGPRSPRAAR
jgi:succinate-semialdehyde dehydrogenase/glutarate-semialdehyde dehydrogenase